MKQPASRLAITAMLSVLTLSAQQPDPQTVRVPVQVSRLDREPVTDLKVSDFAIQEDGIQQKVLSVEVTDGQYVLRYTPAPNPNTGFRTIKVRVDIPNVIVRARSGYWSARK